MNSYTLTLNKKQNYLGMWFSALDSGNELQFYNGNTLVETFLPSNYAALVGACPTSAPEPNYCGNLNASFFNQNSGQQYAYLNFLDTSGSFNKIVFADTVPGYGFESDNHAVSMLDLGTTLPGTNVGTNAGAVKPYVAGHGSIGRSWCHAEKAAGLRARRMGGLTPILASQVIVFRCA